MAHLNRPNEAPPDNFIYTQPETGGRWESNTLGELVTLVRDHRLWKGLKPDEYWAVRKDVEHQICLGMPPGVCAPDPGESYQPFLDKARDMTVESLMEFSMTAFRFIKSGGELVPQDESRRRATICRGCRFNRPSPCTVCTPAFKMIEGLVPSHRVEPGLSACGICGCSLRAKVLLPLTTIRSDDAEHALRYPAYCWLFQPTEHPVTSANA